MPNYIYLSDIHANHSALKQLEKLEEFYDNETQFRYGGDYIDGLNLEKDDTINTLRFIKNHCETDFAQAIIGNHDDFIIKAAFNPYAVTSWSINGMYETLANLNIPFSPDETTLRANLLYSLYDELNWLASLPYMIIDGKNIMVHAGLDLDKSLDEQMTDTLLWVREYYQFAKKAIDFYKDKTIITGHTPTSIMTGEKVNRIVHTTLPVNRYFIDGGSKGSPTSKNRINLLKLDENGNEIWRKYMTEDGIFDYVEEGIRSQIQKYIYNNQITHELNKPLRRTQKVREKEAEIYLMSEEESDDRKIDLSYSHLNKNLIEQYEFLKTLDLEIKPWLSDGQPYNNSKELFDSIDKDKVFYYFPTSNTKDWNNEKTINYPFEEKYDGIYLNDIFRIVHDLFGHYAFKNSFSEDGEIEAWLVHRSCLDIESLPALWTETRGQNAAFYYGPYKDVEISKRPFPEQRIVFPIKELL